MHILHISVSMVALPSARLWVIDKCLAALFNFPTSQADFLSELAIHEPLTMCKRSSLLVGGVSNKGRVPCFQAYLQRFRHTIL